MNKQDDERQKNTQILMLTITEQCNLSCVYCYEKTKHTLRMPIATAKNAIDKAFRDPGKELQIHFHGGEPLLAFNEIKEICEWVWSENRPKPYILYATTNGTLLNGAVRDWVDHNKKRFILGVSLDGTPEMHNRNRSNSFEKIDLSFFKESWPFQKAKMTISKESLPNLAEGVIYLHRQDIQFTANTAFGINWDQNDYEIFAREMAVLTDFYIDNPTLTPVNLFPPNLNGITWADTTRKTRWCGAGRTMTCIGMDGSRYPCHTFMPSSQSGSAAERQNLASKAYSLLQDAESDVLEGKCEGCLLQKMCPTCYGIAQSETGNLASRPEYTCVFTKIRAVASASMYAQMLCGRSKYDVLRELPDHVVAELIDSIWLINNRVFLDAEHFPLPVGRREDRCPS